MAARFRGEGKLRTLPEQEAPERGGAEMCEHLERPCKQFQEVFADRLRSDDRDCADGHEDEKSS